MAAPQGPGNLLAKLYLALRSTTSCWVAATAITIDFLSRSVILLDCVSGDLGQVLLLGSSGKSDEDLIQARVTPLNLSESKKVTLYLRTF